MKKALIVLLMVVGIYILLHFLPRKQSDPLCAVPSTDIVMSCKATEEEVNAELKARGYNLCYGVECGARLDIITDIDNTTIHSSSY